MWWIIGIVTTLLIGFAAAVDYWVIKQDREAAKSLHSVGVDKVLRE